ncbi:MAG TPA: hypothetical protein PLQ19_01135 [Aeromicrobium sp.]|nr:hypothetical protein [Aeromicrobium sp.]
MAKIFTLDYPQSLGVFDSYADAQKAVDHLADEQFPVQDVLIVGTDLKQLERVTGRLTWGRVILSGIAAGAWFGLLIGLLLGIFAAKGQWLNALATGVAMGIVWGVAITAVGYFFSRGERDFSSVKAVLPSKFEVLVEHKHLAKGQELLAGLKPPTSN